MRYLFLIPARAGSKGIPGKNIKLLGGVPLIAYPVKQALEFAPPKDVVVSTDSKEIAEVASRYGASVPFMRPDELASDTASSRSVIIHALDTMRQLGHEYDAVVLLQATSPMRRIADIKACIEAYEASHANMPEGEAAQMAVTVTEARTNPYYSAFETDSRGFLHISKGDGHYTRRQDAPKVWEFNGAVYVIDAGAIRDEEISRMKRTIPVEMPAHCSIDLDTPADWERAENAINRKN